MPRSFAGASSASSNSATLRRHRGRWCTSTSLDVPRVPRALAAQRTDFAARRLVLADFLAVAAEEDVGLFRVRRLARRGDGGLVRRRVVLRLHAEAEAEEDAQRVRVGGERALLSVEEEDLVRERLADAGI